MSGYSRTHHRKPLQPLVDKSLDQFDADGVQTVFCISPFGASETRQERLDRWQAMGSYDPDCKSCEELAAHPTLNAFMPSHKPSSMCRSGSRPHCTCDACF